MASPWCRLWADLPNDPKWRTIARASKQRIGDVLAVYIHMMVCASNATERGRTHGWRDEDIGTALDLETEQVAAIREAMQGRVLDGDVLSGWDRRQSIREDETAAARAKAFREREKEKKAAEEAAKRALENAAQTQPNATERNRTTEVEVEVEVEVEIEVDKKKNTVKNTSPPKGDAYSPKAHLVSLGVPEGVAADWLTLRKAKKLAPTQTAIDGTLMEIEKSGMTVAAAIQHCCVSGWAGFKASWLENQSSRNGAKAAPQNEKFHFANVDRSGDRAAMDLSMKRNNITVEDGDIPF